MGLIIGLLVIWLVLSIVGFAVKGLIWLAIIGLILVVAAGALYAWSRIRPVNHNNVNDEWDAQPDAAAAISVALVNHNPSLMAATPEDHSKPMAQR